MSFQAKHVLLWAVGSRYQEANRMSKRGRVRMSKSQFRIDRVTKVRMGNTYVGQCN